MNYPQQKEYHNDLKKIVSKGVANLNLWHNVRFHIARVLTKNELDMKKSMEELGVSKKKFKSLLETHLLTPKDIE